jgi:hypothetical protein
MKEVHKDYEIEYALTSKWAGKITHLRERLCLPDFPSATKEEGQGVFLARAYAIIDADIAKRTNPHRIVSSDMSQYANNPNLDRFLRNLPSHKERE